MALKQMSANALWKTKQP